MDDLPLPPVTRVIESPRPHRILVVCLRYVGDTLLLRPPVRALKAKFPGARISLLVTAGTECAIEGCSDVDEILEWPRRKWLSELSLLVRIFARRFDWLVDYTGNDRSAVVSLASMARWRITYDRPKMSKWSLRRAAYNVLVRHRKKKPHTLVQRLELIEACGVPRPELSPYLAPLPSEKAWAEGELSGRYRPRLHAHLTSRDMQKAIPIATARKVFEEVLALGGSVFVTSGRDEAERAHVAACTEGFPPEAVKVRSDLTWQELVALISEADAYWGADTAPAHVASALGKSLFVEFGASRATHWYPILPGGTYAVHPCDCLAAKARQCPDGVPGRCMEKAGPGPVLAWLRQVAE